MTSELCGQFIYFLVEKMHTKLRKKFSFNQSLDNEDFFLWALQSIVVLYFAAL